MARRIKIAINLAFTFVIGVAITNLIGNSTEISVVNLTRDRIFFLETAESRDLNFRQICAVESAARQNPDRSVQLFITSSFMNETSSLHQIISRYRNIEMTRVDLAEYFRDSPLEKWYETGDWKWSRFSHVHLSDYMRILTLWKAGGLYLDLDFIVIRRLERSVFKNFIGLQDDSGPTFANGAMHFDQYSRLLEVIIQRMATNYSADSWAGNGPELIASVIMESCLLPETRKRDRWKTTGRTVDCGDLGTVSLLPHRMFYPVNYPSWRDIFDKCSSRRALSAFRKSFAVHVWNKLSQDTPVYKDSNQIYALLAAKYCPLTFRLAPDVF